MLYRYSQKLLNCYVYALDEFLVKNLLQYQREMFIPLCSGKM